MNEHVLFLWFSCRCFRRKGNPYEADGREGNLYNWGWEVHVSAKPSRCDNERLLTVCFWETNLRGNIVGSTCSAPFSQRMCLWLGSQDPIVYVRRTRFAAEPQFSPSFIRSHSNVMSSEKLYCNWSLSRFCHYAKFPLLVVISTTGVLVVSLQQNMAAGSSIEPGCLTTYLQLL